MSAAMDTIKLMAVGDIMLSCNRGTGRMIESEGPHYPFKHVHDYLKQADILFGNLEGPISMNGSSFSGQHPHTTFKAPPEAIHGLVGCGFDVLSLANNHANDYGDEALINTIDFLDMNSIACVGAGRNRYEAYRPVIIEKKDIRVALLGYTSLVMFMTRPATKRRSGVAVFTLRQARKQIRQLIGHVDVIAVSMHWGLDFTECPLPLHRQYAQKMIDAGAHIILGHHPHYLQGIEKYKHGIIAYSLGDFIFDETGQDTMILECSISKNGVQDFAVIPARISEQFQTEVLNKEEGKTVLDKIQLLSEECCSYRPEVADALWKRYISINIYIFLRSFNAHVLRNLFIPAVIGSLVRLLFIKIKDRLKKVPVLGVFFPGNE